MSYTNFWRSIRRTVAPNRLSTAIDLVKAAANMVLTDKERRDLVIKELMKIPGIGENVARLLVEMAVNYVKENN